MLTGSTQANRRTISNWSLVYDFVDDASPFRKRSNAPSLLISFSFAAVPSWMHRQGSRRQMSADEAVGRLRVLDSTETCHACRLIPDVKLTTHKGHERMLSYGIISTQLTSFVYCQYENTIALKRCQE